MVNHMKFGCDEFFSFLFSVGNSIGVLIGITRASKIDSGDSNFYLKAIYTHAAVAIIIWLFSGRDIKTNNIKIIFLLLKYILKNYNLYLKKLNFMREKLIYLNY